MTSFFAKGETIYLDMDGSGNYVAVSDRLSVASLELPIGLNRIAFQMEDTDGDRIDGVMVLSVTATPPTITVQTPDYADGQILKLKIAVYSPDCNIVNQWRINWGDGTETVVHTHSNSLVMSHYYTPGTTETNYDVTLNLIDDSASDVKKNYFLATHSVKAVDTIPSDAAPVSSGETESSETKSAKQRTSFCPQR